MTNYDYLLPAATKLVQGLASKPGVHFVDKKMVSQWVAQALNGMVERGEVPLKKISGGENDSGDRGHAAVL